MSTEKEKLDSVYSERNQCIAALAFMAIEARYGFDLKHAMHLVRLLRMGGELLTTGSMHVYRPDREELLAIRNGAWTYEQLVEWGDSEITRLNSIVANGESVIPKSPSLKKLEELSIEVKEMFLKRCKD